MARVLVGTVREIEWEVDPGAITPRIARNFRTQTGHRVLDVIYHGSELDLDTIAELLWLSHLLRGSTRTLEQCELGVTYETVTPVVWRDDDDKAGTEKIDPAVAPVVTEVLGDPETQGDISQG